MAPTSANLSISPTTVAGVKALLARHYVLVISAVAYLILMHLLRYRRAGKTLSPFADDKRPLSSMTTQKAFEIMTQLQSLEFPYAMNKGRSTQGR